MAKNANNRYATASELQRALYQCLPPAERTNTDEDIGAFIRELFSKRREESRAALADALALADKSRFADISINRLTQSNDAHSDRLRTFAG